MSDVFNIFGCCCKNLSKIKDGIPNPELNVNINVPDNSNLSNQLVQIPLLYDNKNEFRDVSNNEVGKNGVKSKYSSMQNLFNNIALFQEKIVSSEEFNGTHNIKIKKIDTPQILCVGTQTSGKSSLVNNIIGCNIIPTGDNMITRTPLNVSLKNGADDIITLSYIDNGKKIQTFMDKFSTCNTELLRRKISETTQMITGGNYLISKSVLYLEVIYPKFEDLVIVDLPGIVTIAMSDLGQPSSIVQDIKDLIESQLSSNRIYVIVVIQSKTDLETDNGLAIVKELKSRFDIKTIGVLTKPDLLYKKSLDKFNKIFTNEISKDIMVDNGYYVVNNLSPNDNEWYVDFFGKKSPIIMQKRYGINNFMISMKKNINSFLRGHIYEVRKELLVTKEILVKNRPSLSGNIDETSSKILYMITISYILNKILCDSFNSVGNMINIGGKIKDIFNTFHENCETMDPFNKTEWTDVKLKGVIKSFEGYLPTHTKKINLIVSKCLADEETQPIKKIMDYVNKCVVSLVETIIQLTRDTLNKPKIDIYPYDLNSYNVNMQDYPQLIEFMVSKTAEILETYKKNAFLIINSQLSIQEIQSSWIEQADLYAIMRESEMNTLSLSGSSLFQPIETLQMQQSQSQSQTQSQSLEPIQQPEKNSQEEDSLRIPTMASSLVVQPIEPLVEKKSFITKKIVEKKVGMTYINISNEPTYSPSETRMLLQAMFKKIMNQIRESALKTIVASILKEFENKYFIEMTRYINKNTDIDSLFYASVDTVKEKRKYNELIDEINGFIEYMDNII